MAARPDVIGSLHDVGCPGPRAGCQCKRVVYVTRSWGLYKRGAGPHTQRLSPTKEQSE